MRVPWFKHAVLYSLNVETFLDSNGDGIGDFQGIIKSLGYLSNLGVNCIWLLPFYPSPLVDDGYDITDYFNIDPRFGTLADFDELLKKADSYGIRIIIDLVLNHTSDQHWWFQESRSKKTSKFRDFYIWSPERPTKVRWGVEFKGEQKDVWTYDEAAGEYYLHRFYKEEPDLNIVNPEVKNEIKKIIEFWIQRGISGFRIDVAHILIDLENPSEKKGKDFSILNLIHDTAYEKGDVMLLAEANDIASRLPQYFGNNDRMNVIFNFMLNQHLFLSLATEKSLPIEEEVKKLPLQPEKGQWLNFLRHHDELNLDKLHDSEREEIFKVFAPEKNMRIFGNGIRRRLAPMLHNNRSQMEMVHSMIFSFPGIPMIRYGDEIGMGDDLSLPGRRSVRTVMQWSDKRNGGFSTSESHALIMPVIDSGEFGYQKVNVESQENDKNSFLNFMRKIVALRKDLTVIGEGVFSIIDSDYPELLIHKIQGEEDTLIAIHNLSDKSLEIKPDIEFKGARVILGNNNEVDLHHISPYGYRWVLQKTKNRIIRK